MLSTFHCLITWTGHQYTTEFSHLRCTIQWLSVYSQTCVSFTTINLEHFHYPQTKIHTLQLSPLTPTHHPRQVQYCMLPNLFYPCNSSIWLGLISPHKIRKLRHREVKKLAQVYTTSQQWNWNLSLDSLPSEHFS